ncbi:MAG: hypothetical protein JWP28_2463 [Phenylobacterium sp.]|nr:hypothetical protein [Phenylobacterium sp.]MDB5498432.1 hypothetical protein [Phenylobacterium sp.]
MGTARGDFFESYPELVNFDANGWFRASHGGQITFANADVLRTQHKLIAWGGLNPRGPVGNYVIEIALQGGGREIVTQRNGVHRFDRVPAEKFASSLNSQFEESRKTGDPFCYSDQSKAFGRRSFLLEQLGGRERLVPVENARVRTYEERFAARYTRPGQWYAPLLYLRDPATDEPVAYENMVLLLTDPLTLRNFLVNWRSAELDVPTYETVSIHSDAEFDEFMRWVEARGWTAVVDPLLDPTDKNLVSGLPIRSVEALTNAR